jgi:malonyl CoA-acyl carrier protein transacylase
VRTVLNIANGNERERDEVMQGQLEWEDRFQYYMRRIGENAERFRDL